VRHEPTDRAWFAALSALIPPARWTELFPVTPGTPLARHRRLIARKYTPARRAPGRPHTRPAVKTLILQMARDNPLRDHRRIADELLKLGHRIAPSTVREILKTSTNDPAPPRSGPTWNQFLTAQARTMIATDFPHLDTVLLTRLYTLVFIEHGTRRIHLAAITTHPDAASTMQQASHRIPIFERHRLRACAAAVCGSGVVPGYYGAAQYPSVVVRIAAVRLLA
jgi:putative transposase